LELKTLDRILIYPGEIPLETDILSSERNAMIALGKLATAMLGVGPIVNGLACVPTSPASLQVKVQAGEVYQLANIDSSAYSSLVADTTHTMLKQGINLDDTTLTLTAPGSAGQSINYLVQVQFQEVDGGSTVLPYYNSSNPAVAYSGPANSGQPQNTLRKGIVAIQLKQGTAAATGSQVTPTPDSGWVGLWVVTVANAQTQINSGDIVKYTNAPIISERLTDKISQATGDARYVTVGSINPQQSAMNVRGARCANNTSTPNTQFDIAAQSVTLRDASGNTVVQFSPAAKTNNIALSGPAANGRDQVGAFANSSDVHFYYIWGSSPGLNTISSAFGPTDANTFGLWGGVGPQMPSGYTHAAYIGTATLDSSGNLQRIRIAGSDVFYDARKQVLNAGTSTTEATVSCSAFVPAIAGELFVQSSMSAVANASSPATMTYTAALRVITGQDFTVKNGNVSGVAASNGFFYNEGAPVRMPNVSRQFLYQLSGVVGTVNMSAWVNGYTVPNGG
jgi:hypothetical protein